MSFRWKEVTIDSLKADKPNAIAMGPFGSRIKAENFVDFGIPVIKGGNLNGSFLNEDEYSFLTEEKADELRSSNAFPLDIVITHRGTIGQVGIIPINSRFKRYVVSQSQLKVSLDTEKVNPYYVYYFLNSPIGQHRLLMNASQVGVPAIAKASTSVKEILIPLPDKVYQDNIVDMLLSLENKIANNQCINETLEEIAQTVFKSWFIDFEPVKAKIVAIEEGKDPQLAAMCAIGGKSEEELQQLPQEKKEELAKTAELFPDKLVESELGLIPEGWDLIPFGELLEKTIGGDWGKDIADEKHTEEVKIIRGTDIPTLRNGSIEKVPTRFVDPKKLKTRKLQDGDIVIEVSGGSKDQPTGRSIMLTKNHILRLGLDAEPASFCRLFRPINSALSYLLGQHLLYIYDEGKTWYYQNQSTGISNFQTAVFLEKELIPIPNNRELLNTFRLRLVPILNKISSNENIKLTEIRDSLLPKLLNGEI